MENIQEPSVILYKKAVLFVLRTSVHVLVIGIDAGGFCVGSRLWASGTNH